ncbi:Phage repressor protein C, contains Cro/C1-type HTH and peptisase s24 domains [Mesorhizobium qingshengii]|uniref:Phage repressor protein C, contains Cro/C1-type HTH and peptisase s24 domains n=2 Tax=Mesorhizobium qingshengii TaxID=1165689 RepID=A0A1G5V1P4_9HYPH|nr:helix-turn-helix transcriptional regulator [Mesorhizobium qingshengii]SDA39538.1 Phage repressor protein C, contains Cro/C1-type HTH and peptisase s24 domains [Mesorhizobium qingshengii]
MTQTTFHERLSLAMAGESAHAFAKRAGLSDSSFRQYLQGSMPGLDNLVLIANAAEVSLDWLALGRGEMRPVNGKAPAPMMTAGEAPHGFVNVPKIEIRPSAGAGSLDLYEESEPDIFAFREEWLRRIGVSPKFARLMVAKGDSMRETINDGDLMIVDVSIREFIDEAIYVLVYGGLVRLKRLQMLRSGLLLLKSDNPHYQTEEVPLAEQPELIIGGRVRWAGGAI